MIIACVVCKATHCFLRFFGKGATSLPGRLALFICPELLSLLSKNVSTIAITGTNGKTTSARMAERALQNAGFEVFSNKSGANLREGIAAAFVMNTDLLGRVKIHGAVIECDEAACKKVLGEIKPRVLLVTNLFKDQSDRYGDVKTPVRLISEGLENSPETRLAVNADCHLAWAIAEKSGHNAVYFGHECKAGKEPDPAEENRCFFCGGKLKFSAVSYSNSGRWHCPSCGRKSPEPGVKISRAGDKLMAEAGEYRALFTPALPALYNEYNAAGVIAAVSAAGLNPTFAVSAAESFERGFGRMESFPLGRAGAEMILVKNTAAVNETLDYIKSLEGGKILVFAQNARAGDGRDLDWLNSADFEKLRRIKGINRIICAGDCAGALLERLEKAGIKSELCSDYESLIRELTKSEDKIFLLPSYTAMLELRQRLIKRLGGKNFWD